MSETITDNVTYTIPYLKPTQGDDGDQFGQIIETFMEGMAAHTHDGQTSNKIDLNITKDSHVFDNASNQWTLDTSNNYGSYLTLPTASSTTRDSEHFRRYYVNFGDLTTPQWEEVFPKIVWVDQTHYKLYLNINNKDIKVYTI